MADPTVGVLALQGAFRPHVRILRELGASVREVRTPAHLEQVDGLVIPGGESTVMGLGIAREGLAGPLRAFPGPVFGTCAGLIMLDQAHLGLMDVDLQRNAYGPQIFSHERDVHVAGVGVMRAIFIRAPVVTRTGPGVGVLAETGGHPVAVAQGRLLATTFHPELTGDSRVHERFLSLVGAPAPAPAPALA